MYIRNAEMQDLPEILKIYERARAFMAAHGNPNQWGPNKWPPEALLAEDIGRKSLFVAVADGEELCGKIAAVFAYFYGPHCEDTYDEIDDGAWIGEETYGVVHRIASAGIVKGAGEFCIRWALAKSGHLRIDTHTDNTVMQGLLAGLGFTKCGIIYVHEDRDPRLAYEKLESGESCSNYERMKEDARVLFRGYDQKKIMLRRGILTTETHFLLEMMGQKYRVHRADGTVTAEEAQGTWRPADFNEALTVYDILCYPDYDPVPCGRRISQDSLVTLISNTGNPGHGMYGKTEAFLEGKEEALARALAEMGGKPEGKGDVAFRLPFFGAFDYLVSFYGADDEFPPTLMFFWDEQILKLIHFETVWYVSGMIIDRITEGVRRQL